jgi:hypothetical protein
MNDAIKPTQGQAYSPGQPIPAELVSRIREAHQRAEKSIVGWAQHAYDAGCALLELKRTVPHGEYMPAVARCGFAHSTALLYRNVALLLAPLGNSQGLANLTFDDVAGMLAEARKLSDKGEWKLLPPRPVRKTPLEKALDLYNKLDESERKQFQKQADA